MKLALILCGTVFSYFASAGTDCSKQAEAAVKSCQTRLESAQNISTTNALQKAEETCQKQDEKSCIDQCGRASRAATKHGELELSELDDQIQGSCSAKISRLLEMADDARDKLVKVSAEARDAASAVFGNVDHEEQAKSTVDSAVSDSENVSAKPICFHQGGVLKTTLAVPIGRIEEGLAMINNGYFGPGAVIVPCP